MTLPSASAARGRAEMQSVIIFANQYEANVGQKAFPDHICISPSAQSIRARDMKHVVVMPNVDMYQHIDGIPLHKLIEGRMMTFPKDERRLVQLQIRGRH